VTATNVWLLLLPLLLLVASFVSCLVIFHPRFRDSRRAKVVNLVVSAVCFAVVVTVVITLVAGWL